MSRNRVYTGLFSRSCAPANNADINFRINNSNRASLLRSITMDMIIIEMPGVASVLNLNTQTTQYFTLAVIGSLSGGLIGQTFIDIAPAAAIVANGTQIELYKPQKIDFNSFHIVNELTFFWTYHNSDALLSYLYYLSVVVEIEDIPIKYAK